MTAPATTTPSARTRALWLAGAVELVFLLPAPLFVATGYQGGGGGRGNLAVVVVLTVGIGAIHARHAAATLRGVRPAGWPATLLALAVLVYAPIPFWTYNWASTQWFLIASALMVLPRRVAVVGSVLVVCGTAGVAYQQFSVQGAVGAMLLALYWITALTVSGGALYGSARLVRLLDELAEARAELATGAIGRERLRISRDLHDLLGQSLSAVSLKGDLALALLHRDPVAARAEVSGITELARTTLHGIRAVTHDTHHASLRTEIDGAAALLAAAGISTTLDIDPIDLPAPIDAVLGWAVREAVTNLLRHAEPRHCDIRLRAGPGPVRLSVVNDGAPGVDGSEDGSGLAGLTERVHALAGRVEIDHDDDRFTLTVHLPVGEARP